ncbi:signal recognition particle-docking protein FtsY [Picosynechococcus sp. PCC 7117]|uniref:signal recognition particle-docking protein FtsY n=1 Tax=Picosynechococcus sp. PCC 7117 TaxID=195498 RepID=UPI0008105E44|nr:signal recognition particle-docking protein FtsY [Picosynechococcus sp. PCC 7117]ANV88841.1 signal recognition particle-docking protein FtsY [Picosynechococcus sp. PCC 7117]
MFDWFRRKTTDKSQDTSEPTVTEKQVPESPTEEAAAPEPETPSTPEIDYLNWAKSAYKNIQAKKGIETTETPQPEATEPQEPELESTPAETEPETPAPEPTAEAPETAPETIEAITPQPEAPAEAVSPEPDSEPTEVEAAATVAPVAPEPEPEVIAAEVESTPDSETVAEPEPETTPATPAWMQKSDGLEKLKETAIDTEGLEFDENFLWSAKVLADQGRDASDISLEEIEWLKKLRDGLGKTRRSLVNQLKAVVGQGPLNDEAVLEIESLLLQADVGIEATDYIIETLQERLRQEALPPEAAITYLKEILRDILDKPLAKLPSTEFAPEADKLNVWMLTGVNGAGKTTTIGKLAHLANQSGYRCVIAAADTFRAAAVEQVKVWGERTDTPVIANPGKNTDPAAVVFDGITAAQARQAQILLVDTAGRLQNKKNLMDELAKIRRIVDKKAPDAQVESLLVLDATLGQNGLRQAQVFSEAAKLSGVVLTKLDGTARGGVALAVSQQLGLPIRFIGAGEGIEDLRPFSSYEFVEALLDG